MAVIKALVLGVLQGLTEFLPVSSSGHLVLGQHLLGLAEPELLFDVVVHAGTLAAILLVFRREVGAVLAEVVRLRRSLASRERLARAWRERPAFRLLVLLAAGSVPTAAIGLLFRDLLQGLFASTLAVSLALLGTGSILFLTRWIRTPTRDLTRTRLSDALLIGLAQGAAITPGLSRSGLTISTGLFLGLDRDLAARYSFLLSLPAILGALGLEALSPGPGSFAPPELAAGFAAAFVSGAAALVALLRVVRHGRLHYFAYYCWLVGLLALGLTGAG